MARLFAVVPTLSCPSGLVELLFHPRRIRCQVEREPAVPGTESLGLAVWAFRMLPKPPEKVLKFKMRSYLTCSLFPPPETYGHLVVESRTLVSAWRVVDCH